MSKKSFSTRLHSSSLSVAIGSIMLLHNGVQAAEPLNHSSGLSTSTVPTAPDSTLDPIDRLPPAPEDIKAAKPVTLPTTFGVATNKAIVQSPTATATPTPVIDKSSFSHEPLHSIAQRMKLPLPFPKARIVVTKSQRRLDLYNGQTLMKSYGIALGSQPVGPKQDQGDGRTPEGRFYICTRNSANSSFHIFLGLSYPALPDATRAVNKKVISWQDYLAIRQRLASRGAPLWRTRLGGWVGIHGGTDGAFAQKRMKERGRSDWTGGCIALTNAEIEEVYAATRTGTPVTVLP